MFTFGAQVIFQVFCVRCPEPYRWSAWARLFCVWRREKKGEEGGLCLRDREGEEGCMCEEGRWREGFYICSMRGRGCMCV